MLAKGGWRALFSLTDIRRGERPVNQQERGRRYVRTEIQQQYVAAVENNIGGFMIVLQWFYVMGAMQTAHTSNIREQEKKR